jgi:hypothetical protein
LVHGERAFGQFLQVLADLVAVHGAAYAGKQPQNYQSARSSVQFLLELSIRGFSVQFD